MNTLVCYKYVDEAIDFVINRGRNGWEEEEKGASSHLDTHAEGDGEGDDNEEERESH